MNYDLEIPFYSLVAESALATVRIKDGIAEFKGVRNIAVKNDGDVDLVVTFQYKNTAGNYVDTDIADETVVAKASNVFKVWCREGQYMRILGSGLTNGKIVMFEVGPATSSIDHRDGSDLNIPAS